MVGIENAQTPPPVRACDPRSRMQGKAARTKAQGRRTHPGGRIFQDPAQALAGACPGGGEPSHRSRGESRQHGFLVGERIRCSVVEQAAFRDWAAECTDAPCEVCEIALAHVNSDRVEAAYRRSDLFEKRRCLMRDWAAYIADTR